MSDQSDTRIVVLLEGLKASVEDVKKQQADLKTQQAEINSNLGKLTTQWAQLDTQLTTMQDRTLPPIDAKSMRNAEDIVSLRTETREAMNKAQHLEEHYQRTEETVKRIEGQLAEVKSYIWKAMGALSVVLLLITLFAVPLMRQILSDDPQEAPRKQPIEIHLVQPPGGSPITATPKPEP